MTSSTSTTSRLRIATYNIEDDINGNTTPLPGLYQDLEGIGEEVVQGYDQPIDILTLNETTSNSVTVAPIVSALNTYYNGGRSMRKQLPGHARRQQQRRQWSQRLGLQHLHPEPAGFGGGRTPGGSSNGEYRQVVRYEFQPVGDTGFTGIFDVYVSHMKSGTGTTNANYRGEEAEIILNDEATLPANSSVIYTGDLNSNPPEAEFTDFQASGPGQANDPLNWPTGVQYFDDSSTDLKYRDCYELSTMNILDGTGAINYISGTLHTFGNNGTVASGGSVSSSANTSLNSDLVQDGGTFVSASTLYADLATGSDHLPVVADYSVASASPATR